jgi:hypothetical protein
MPDTPISSETLGIEAERRVRQKDELFDITTVAVAAMAGRSALLIFLPEPFNFLRQSGFIARF